MRKFRYFGFSQGLNIRRNSGRRQGGFLRDPGKFAGFFAGDGWLYNGLQLGQAITFPPKPVWDCGKDFLHQGNLREGN